MCQRRPTDPMDPGDAADLSIMGLLAERPEDCTDALSFGSDSRASTLGNQQFLNRS